MPPCHTGEEAYGKKDDVLLVVQKEGTDRFHFAKLIPLLRNGERKEALVQQIRNLVERGESREQIAEILDVTVGSLQVTCSRLGISLRRPKVDNGARLLRQLNSISRKKTITMHDPIDRDESALSQPTEQQSQQNSQSGPAEPAPAAKPQQDRLQTLEAGSPSVAIRFQYKGTERTTELPLNLDMIGRLACEAEFRNTAPTVADTPSYLAPVRRAEPSATSPEMPLRHLVVHMRSSSSEDHG